MFLYPHAPTLPMAPSTEGFPCISAGKESTAMWETRVRSLGREDPCIVLGVTTSQTRLSDRQFHFHPARKLNINYHLPFTSLFLLQLCAVLSC